MKDAIKVTAWNNGSHLRSGACYGVKLSAFDRDVYFDKAWKSIYLELEGESDMVVVNIAKRSFWDPKCRELINQEIGKWFIKNDLAPWPKNEPPKLKLYQISGNRFRLVF